MAQVIAPEVWQEGINDNRLLPGRYTNGIFTGSGVKIANNNEACRVWDIQVTDYITDYDDRRINGHANYQANTDFNKDGRDGWGASAYGVFQDVRFESRIYTMGRHRSVAMRIFDEMQYAGEIGNWGNASRSNVITPGQSLMKTAAIISKAKDIWSKQVLGPDIDKYNLFAILNGHMAGRWVAVDPVTGDNYTDRVMDGNAAHGQWVAQPGMVEGQPIMPRFAPIHGIQWDQDNIPLMLQNIKVTWNNLHIPQENRVILIDPFYEYNLLASLTGKGVPATDSAYADLQNGSFTRLMGWDFNFEIPSEYWPTLYFDDNMNVVHSADGGAAYDAIINSTSHANDPNITKDKQLLYELIDMTRMSQLNYVRTDWNAAAGRFEKTITNYPLGQPVSSPYYGAAVETAKDTANTGVVIDGGNVVNRAYNLRAAKNRAALNAYDPTTDGVDFPDPTDIAALRADLDWGEYPWNDYGGGIGLWPYDANSGMTAFPNGPMATGPQIAGDSAQLLQVIGCAVYKPAAQLSQEYSSMVTDEGKTRGKFTEMVFDVKYDAWVIEGLSHGILPIVASDKIGDFAIPVKVMDLTDEDNG